MYNNNENQQSLIRFYSYGNYENQDIYILLNNLDHYNINEEHWKYLWIYVSGKLYSSNVSDKVLFKLEKAI